MLLVIVTTLILHFHKYYFLLEVEIISIARERAGKKIMQWLMKENSVLTANEQSNVCILTQKTNSALEKVSERIIQTDFELEPAQNKQRTTTLPALGKFRLLMS